VIFVPGGNDAKSKVHQSNQFEIRETLLNFVQKMVTFILFEDRGCSQVNVINLVKQHCWKARKNNKEY
jgi:hypothetical protein